jgi:CheY-like chemotaxis protein/HPt (histidine-containing phosphotransfer) domain-containing protein
MPKEAGVRILVAEDGAINREILRELLGQASIDVAMAEDGWAVLTLLEQHQFDLILMDLQMPALDGVQATEIIRRWPALRDLPIIAMTALPSPEDLNRCFAAGMNDHIAKPIDPDVLYDTIARWLGHRSSPPQSPPETQYPDVHLPGIDAVAGLRVVNGNKDKFLAVVARFDRDFAGCCGRLRTMMTADDRKGIAALAHSLRGAAANIGAVSLAKAAGEVERLARAGGGCLDDSLPSRVDDVVAECETIRHASALAASLDAERQIGRAGGDDPSFEVVSAALRELLESRRFIPDAVVYALQASAAGLPPAQLEALIRAIDRFDYREAVVGLDALCANGCRNPE